jgi:hypothetical protein
MTAQKKHLFSETNRSTCIETRGREIRNSQSIAGITWCCRCHPSTRPFHYFDFSMNELSFNWTRTRVPDLSSPSDSERKAVGVHTTKGNVV